MFEKSLPVKSEMVFSKICDISPSRLSESNDVPEDDELKELPQTPVTVGTSLIFPHFAAQLDAF